MTPLRFRMGTLCVPTVTHVVVQWPWTNSQLMLASLSSWSLLGCLAQRRRRRVMTPLLLKMEALEVSSVTRVVARWP